jgi:hypothetical protein
MADNNQILPQSFGMPWVWIFDKDDNTIIMDNGNGGEVNINQLIKKFSYKYDEENDDTCNITIMVSKPEQLNHPILIEDTKLKAQFGYLLPGGDIVKSVKRTIAIRDIDENYKSDGIELTIKCTDLVSYLRNIKYNQSSDKDNFGDWIDEIISDSFVATRTVRGKTQVIKSNKAKTGLGSQNVIPGTQQPITPGVPQPGSSLPFNLKQTGQTKNEYYTEAFNDNNINPENKMIVGGIGFQGQITVVEKDQVIKGKSKALYQEIQDRLNSSPDGPAFIDSRDNIIDIKTRNFQQPNYRNFTYAGNTGELIDFKPTSNVVTVNGDEAESSFLNPETKIHESQKSTFISDHGELPEQLNELDLKRVYGQLEDMFEYNAQNPLDQKQFDDIVFKKLRRITNRPAEEMGISKILIEERLKFSAKTILSLPYFDKIKREAFVKNYIEKKIQRKYEARAKTIGDPSIISSKVYGFYNVSRRNKGSWYCTAAEHIITPGEGYTTIMDLIRKPKVLARVIEKREKDNQGKTLSKDYKETDIMFTEEPTDGNPISFLNKGDISERIRQQELAENFYQNDNDIYFESKKDLNNFKEKPNNTDV